MSKWSEITRKGYHMGISDGANDVNVIATAHVSIVIEGLEGVQAAIADCTIS